MNLMERRRALMSALSKFIRVILGKPPLTLEACVDDKSTIDYKVYGESVQDGTPTPDTPIEVESVGEKTINIFNPNEAVLNGGTVDGNTFISTKIDYYLKAGTYTLALTGVGVDTVYLRKGQVDSGYFASLSKIQTNRGVSKFTFDEDGYLRISHFNNGAGIKDVMLVEGDYNNGTMPDYEPYGYKVPIITSGKNLFDEKKLITMGFTLQADGRYYDYSTKSYTLWENTMGIKGSINIRANIECSGSKGFEFRTTYTDGTYMWGIGTTNKSKTVSKIELSNSALRETWISNILISTVLSSNDYEPYQEPITTNIYLDEPLRKIGNYADYIDFENRLVVRNTQVKSFDGSESWYVNDNTYALANWDNKLTPLHMYTEKQGYKCNIAKENENNGGFFTHNQPNVDWIVFYVLDIIPTLEEWKEYLKNNNVYVVYSLANPTETLIELPQLPTFKGTTIYSIDTNIQPSNMEVSYYSKERSVS